MTYRLEVDMAYGCKPKKGERRAKDGTGRLVKCSIFNAETWLDAIADAKRNHAVGERLAPGYAEVIEVRGWSNYVPLTAPDYTAKNL